MDDRSRTDASDSDDSTIERTTQLLAHLNGVLDESMLDAMQGAWTTLEDAATDVPAHGRAVRARMMWETMQPGTPALVADPLVTDLVPIWDEDEDVADAA
jgi:alkanesulfonate monooxygenase SsuD/methylene tetrahydromethanopterin reductase-like flavin-dependent oxidoreductase (luciferase family)